MLKHNSNKFNDFPILASLLHLNAFNEFTARQPDLFSPSLRHLFLIQFRSDTSKMIKKMDDLTDLLLKSGFVHCIDCGSILPKGELIQHCEQEHKNIRRLSDQGDQGK